LLTKRVDSTRLLLLLLLALPGVVKANFLYITNSATITITGYSGPGGAVTIPGAINGLPVTSIGAYAFYHASLGSVAIPNSVTNIGVHAFYACAGLTNVTIESSVTSIGNYAFIDCTGLTSVTIPRSVTRLGNGVFGICPSLSAITVDPLNPAYSSEGGTLFDKSQSTLVQFPAGEAGTYIVPDSVTNIAALAFAYCANLTNVTIPNNVISIGMDAFVWCTSLTSVTIPNSVTRIGQEAFGACQNLSAITVDPLNPAYSSVDGVLFDKSQATLVQCPAGKAGTYIVPDSVTSIASSSFYNCASLTKVMIPNSVAFIGGYAFYACNSLTTIVIPAGVTNILRDTFHFCANLASVYFEGDCPTVGSLAFFGDNDATMYYLPGTTGWGSTCGGRPTMLWNPLIQGSDFGLCVRSNRCAFTITGTTDIPIVVEACTNLRSASWTSLQSCTLTNGSIYFSDPQRATYPIRFYRIRSP
jgi:hypothetical protein